ncbi:MAG: sigma-70 family RNA polymerase sigma factor [Polyangiales bacterium]
MNRDAATIPEPVCGLASRPRGDVADPEISDRDLIARMLGRDERAWRVFVARYGSIVRAAIRRILRRFSEAAAVDADDVYAAIMGTLVAHDMAALRQFDPERGTSFAGWLSRLAANRTWDHLRGCRRTWRTKRIFEQAAATSFEPDPEQTLILRDQCRDVLDLYAGMTPRDRRVFELRFLQNATTQEVCERMQIATNTVHTKCFKIRASLARALEQPSASRAMQRHRGAARVRGQPSPALVALCDEGASGYGPDRTSPTRGGGLNSRR